MWSGSVPIEECWSPSHPPHPDLCPYRYWGGGPIPLLVKSLWSDFPIYLCFLYTFKKLIRGGWGGVLTNVDDNFCRSSVYILHQSLTKNLRLQKHLTILNEFGITIYNKKLGISTILSTILIFQSTNLPFLWFLSTIYKFWRQKNSYMTQIRDDSPFT